MLYRLARPDDAEALVLLNAAFNGVDDRSPEDIRRSLAQSAETVVVAEQKAGIIAGFCCAQVHHSFCYSAPVAEITEMYVMPACRRQGLASGMLRFLEAYLLDSFGTDELHLLTGTENLTAQSAYKKAGFRMKNEVYMTKELPRKR